MLQVDLSTLRGPELRQLLDATRRRGQAQASYEILREMAARRERNGRDRPRALFTGAPPSEERTIEVSLGDPLEPAPEPYDEEAYEETRDTARDFANDPDEGLRLAAHWDRTEPIGEEATFLDRPHEIAPGPKPPPSRRRWGWTFAALVFGLTAGVVLGWSLNEIARDLSPAPVAAAALAPPAAAPQVQTAPLPPAAPAAPDADTSAISPVAAPDVSAAAATGVAPSDLHAPAATAPAATEAAQDNNAAVPTPAAPIPAVPPEGKKAKAVTSDSARAASDDAVTASVKGCAAQPTPADRTICGDPRLQKLQRELRQAYADALDAHQDRDLLRERQLAWRDARSDIADPDRLAKLYEERIRKLTAAAAEARAQR